MPPRHLHNRIHVRKLTVEMNRQNRLGARGDPSLDCSRIHVERAWIDVDQHRARPSVKNRGNTGYKSEWYGNDFVSGPDSRGQQGQMQGTGAGIHGNAILCAAIACEFLLKRQYFATQNKLTRLQDLGDGRVDLWLDVLVLDFRSRKGTLSAVMMFIR